MLFHKLKTLTGYDLRASSREASPCAPGLQLKREDAEM